jgi:hypothetical protein
MTPHAPAHAAPAAHFAPVVKKFVGGLCALVFVNVRGTTLEDPPAQPNGGGFNSSLGVRSVTLAAPLAPGQSVGVQFLFGIQQPGDYRFAIVVETLPFLGSDVWVLSGNTETANDTEGSN